MKIMIASDIHGSAEHCRLLIERMEAEQPEKLLLLGDLLYHGPRNDLLGEYAPRSVSEQLNEIKDRVICVHGNCDAEVDQAMLEFSIMAEQCLLFCGERVIYATHGHRYNERSLPPLQKGDVLLTGHTHVPAYVDHGHFIYINPGSVSLPKGGSCHSYLMLTDGLLEWKNLQGETYMTRRI